MKWLLVALGVLIGGPAMAQTTPCPTVTDYVGVLTVFIVNPPKPIGLATYFPQYNAFAPALSIQWAGPGMPNALYVVGVPLSMATNPQLPWASLSGFPQAIVQDGSTCPILLTTGKPLLAVGSVQPK